MLNAILLGAIVIAGLGAILILADILRFAIAKRKAESPDAVGVHAGGTLYIQGGKTYYRMPKGQARKVADYAMDLRPGSKDMDMFTEILNQAAVEHDKEVAEAKGAAVQNMREIAKDEAAR